KWLFCWNRFSPTEGAPQAKASDPMSDSPSLADAGYPVTRRSKVRRLPKRGSSERAQVHAILDAHFLCHIGYVIDAQPYVTPTGYWRHGDRIYWHGSSASRMLRAQTAGIPVCPTLTLVDGLGRA